MWFFIKHLSTAQTQRLHSALHSFPSCDNLLFSTLDFETLLDTADILELLRSFCWEINKKKGLCTEWFVVWKKRKIFFLMIWDYFHYFEWFLKFKMCPLYTFRHRAEKSLECSTYNIMRSLGQFWLISDNTIMNCKGI